MNNIKNYQSFNEKLLSGFSNKVGKTFKSLKRSLFSEKISNPDLEKYDITYQKVSDIYYKFLHNKRVIAELRLEGDINGMPSFRLTSYFYKSEIPNKDNLQLNKKFEGQEEQPYAKGSKLVSNTEKAIDTLIHFWSTKTNSGRSRNKDFKINL